MRNMMSKLKLTVNESKTRVCRLPEEEFDFLGYTFGRCYCLGPVSQAYRAVEQHTCRRLRQWLCVKHKERAGGNTRFPQKALHQKFGLVRLTARTASFPWANA